MKATTNGLAVWGGTSILGLSLILAACNTQKVPTETGGEVGGTVACTVTVTSGAGGFAYSPDKCTIKAGQKISVVSNGAHPLIGTTPGGPIDSTKTTVPTDPAVNTVNITFPTAGTFGFKCNIHSSMVGTVTVTN
jgi:plastocyanin